MKLNESRDSIPTVTVNGETVELSPCNFAYEEMPHLKCSKHGSPSYDMTVEISLGKKIEVCGECVREYIIKNAADLELR